MTLSVGGTVVVEANGKVQWARISGAPTLYYNVATTRLVSDTNSLTNIETTGTTIRCAANVAAS